MNWDEIRNEWETTKITLAALAEKHGVKLGTLKSRKSRDAKDGNEWTRDASKKDATKTEKVATIKKKGATKKAREPNTEINLDNFLEDAELTDKQRLFCLYYVKSFNATQAAINAGYSPVSAHVEGNRLLKNDKVREQITEIKRDMVNGIFIEARDVLDKYIKIAFSDIGDYLTFGKRMQPIMGAFGPVLDEKGQPIMEEVNFVDFKDSVVVDGTIISEVKQGRDGVSIKLEDRMKALDKLSLYFDLFPDKFKRQIEEEKLKLAHFKTHGNEEEEYEDDGFIDALDGKEVDWDEEA